MSRAMYRFRKKAKHAMSLEFNQHAIKEITEAATTLGGGFKRSPEGSVIDIDGSKISVLYDYEEHGPCLALAFGAADCAALTKLAQALGCDSRMRFPDAKQFRKLSF